MWKISSQVVIRFGHNDFFNSKKRDLSNNSNTEEDVKRQNRILTLLETPKLTGDVFKESLKSEDCRKNLLNCLKN